MKRKFQEPENQYKFSHFQNLTNLDMDIPSFLCEYFIVGFFRDKTNVENKILTICRVF